MLIYKNGLTSLISKRCNGTLATQINICFVLSHYGLIRLLGQVQSKYIQNVVRMFLSSSGMISTRVL